MEWGRIIDDIENTTGRSVVKAVGCRSQYVSDLRSGKSKNPGADFVLKLINEFNLSVRWLLTGEGEMFNIPDSTGNNNEALLFKTNLASEDMYCTENIKSYETNTIQRINEIITQLGISASSFARSINTPQTTLSNILNRGTEPRAELLGMIVKTHNVSAHWLLTGEGEMFNGRSGGGTADSDDGLLSLPLLKAELASTDLCDEANVESYVKPLRLITQSSAAKIFAVQSLDWQMCGVGISLGDTIFFDAATCNDRADNIYCVALNGKIYCKWLCFGQDEVRVYSIDTSAHSEKQPFGNFGADSGFRVLGRVVAWLHKNHIIYAD